MTARRAMESLTLDRGEMHLKDELSPRYAELVYNGFWFSPERLALQAAVDHTQQYVTGVVRVKLYKARALRWLEWLKSNGCGLGGYHLGGEGSNCLRPQRCQSLQGFTTCMPCAHAPCVLGNIVSAYQELLFQMPPGDAPQTTAPESQRFGLLLTTTLACVQGNVIVVGRKSPYSLYDEKIASFEDDGGLYDQKDAAGFIKLQVRPRYPLHSVGPGNMKQQCAYYVN